MAWTMRAFLEADDGREFVMLNLVKANLELVPDPMGDHHPPGHYASLISVPVILVFLWLSVRTIKVGGGS